MACNRAVGDSEYIMGKGIFMARLSKVSIELRQLKQAYSKQIKVNETRYINTLGNPACQRD